MWWGPQETLDDAMANNDYVQLPSIIDPKDAIHPDLTRHQCARSCVHNQGLRGVG